MSIFSTQTLIQATHRLLAEIGAQTQIDVDDLQLQRLEHTARALCGQLKALSEIDALNAYAEAKTQEQSYTRYEDLPPLSPEEQERLKQHFITLLDADRIKHEAEHAPELSGRTKTQH